MWMVLPKTASSAKCVFVRQIREEKAQWMEVLKIPQRQRHTHVKIPCRFELQTLQCKSFLIAFSYNMFFLNLDFPWLAKEIRAGGRKEGICREAVQQKLRIVLLSFPRFWKRSNGSVLLRLMVSKHCMFRLWIKFSGQKPEMWMEINATVEHSSTAWSFKISTSTFVFWKVPCWWPMNNVLKLYKSNEAETIVRIRHSATAWFPCVSEERYQGQLRSMPALPGFEWQEKYIFLVLGEINECFSTTTKLKVSYVTHTLDHDLSQCTHTHPQWQD